VGDALSINSEIFQIGGGGFTSPEDAAVYLMYCNGHAALVDAGCGYSVDTLLENIDACDVRYDQIDYLLITHCHFDHTGGAKALSEKVQCEVVAHELEAHYLEQGDNEVTGASWYGSKLQPFQVDRKLSGAREDIFLGERKIEAIHVPGHSPGSVIYVIESQGSKVVFAQDVHGPIHPDLLSDREKYIQSLKLLLELDADILCEGHFGVYTGKKEVTSFIQSYLMDS
jgi:glyoxylase-like metal-dependent hydrolase (beta-lactamase superfamily II)